jgi:hypothetical protein
LLFTAIAGHPARWRMGVLKGDHFKVVRLADVHQKY